MRRSCRRPTVEAAFQRGGVEAGAAQQGVGGVDEGKGADKLAGQALAPEPRPGPGGVDAAQVVAGVELVREFEVVVDAEDGLSDLHGFYRMLAEVAGEALPVPVYKLSGSP